jgi:DNA-binding FadR family transcriptional regulator
MAGDLKTVGALLMTCSEIEFLAGEFYRLLSRLHTHEPEAVALWLKTAKEEDNHKLQFDLGQRLSSTVACGAVLDQRQAARVVQSFQDAIAQIAASPVPPTVRSALQIAIKMKSMMMEFHMDHAVVFTSDSYREMFKAMMAQDYGHIQALKDFLDRCESVQLPPAKFERPLSDALRG